MAPLLYLHVPKTAGSSLRELFRRQVPAERRLEVYGGELRLGGPDAAFVAAARQRLGDLELIYGHFSFGVHRFLGVAPRYAVFLRHPLERVVSLYRHFERHPGEPFHDEIRAGLNLAAWVASGATEMTNNHACRMLSGTVPVPGRREDDPDVLAAALKNVERHFVFVGVMDRFAADAARLVELLGWSEREVSHLNRAPGPRSSLPAAIERVVLEHNRLDLELYRRMLERGSG